MWITGKYLVKGIIISKLRNMGAGRPRIYSTDIELQVAVDEYFIAIKGIKQQTVNQDGTITEVWLSLPEPATVTGLALALGFESRQSVYDYEKSGEFSYIIKQARMKVECEYEKKLTTASSPVGSIFALKNMGWKDKNETDMNLSGGLNINMQPAPNCAPVETK